MNRLLAIVLMLAGCASPRPELPSSLTHGAVHAGSAISTKRVTQQFSVRMPSVVSYRLGVSPCGAGTDEIVWVRLTRGYSISLEAGCYHPWLYVPHWDAPEGRIGVWMLDTVYVTGDRKIELVSYPPLDTNALEVIPEFSDERAKNLLTAEGIGLLLLPKGQVPSKLNWLIANALPVDGDTYEVLPGTYDVYLQLPDKRAVGSMIPMVMEAVTVEAAQELTIPVDVTTIDFIVCESQHDRDRPGSSLKHVVFEHRHLGSFIARYYAGESQTVLLWPGEWTATIHTGETEVVREFQVPDTTAIKFQTSSETDGKDGCQ